MKKMICVLCAIAIVFSVSVYASNTPTVVVSDAEGSAGRLVDVTVSLQNNPGIISLWLQVDYDSSAMTLEGVADSGTLPGAMHSQDYSSDPYVLYWDNGDSAADFTVNSTVATLQFRIHEDATKGEYDINVFCSDAGNIINAQLKPVAFNMQSGSVTVGDPKPQLIVSHKQSDTLLSVDLDIFDPDSVGGILYVAKYGKNGRMISAEKLDPATKSYEASIAGIGSVKVMWLRDMETMVPIAPAWEITLVTE